MLSRLVAIFFFGRQIMGDGDASAPCAKTPRQSMEFARVLGELQASRVELQKLQKHLHLFKEQHARDVQALQDQLLALSVASKQPPAKQSKGSAAAAAGPAAVVVGEQLHPMVCKPIGILRSVFACVHSLFV